MNTHQYKIYAAFHVPSDQRARKASARLRCSSATRRVDAKGIGCLGLRQLKNDRKAGKGTGGAE